MDVASTLQQDKLVHSYLFLRRAIGLIGILLPFALVIGVYVETGQILSSISGYYYSDMRDVYVGAMCAVGVFLIFYHGMDRTDDLFSYLAGSAAIGVALFPTRPAGNPTDAAIVVGYVHIACAGVFFLTLALFCLWLFRRSATPLTPRQRQRHQVYIASGVIILLCLAAMVVFGMLLEAETRDLLPALWLEAVAILAFGVSWLVKGQTLLKD